MNEHQPITRQDSEEIKKALLRVEELKFWINKRREQLGIPLR